MQRTIYPSVARTATPAASVFQIRRHHGSALRLVVDVTAIVSTPSIVVTVDILDAVSGKWCNVLTSAAITTVSTTMLGPIRGLAAEGSARITVTHGNANSITYTVAAHHSETGVHI